MSFAMRLPEFPLRNYLCTNNFDEHHKHQAIGNGIRSFALYSEDELEKKLENAWNAFQDYRRLPIAERARVMKVAAEILECEKVTFGRLMTAEMGKTFRSALEECGKCAMGLPVFRR